MADELERIHAELEQLRAIGDRLAEQIMQLLGPLSTEADDATVRRHQEVRRGALADWAEAQQNRRAIN